MKHVKENDLAHGEFGKWLEEVGFNDRMARKFMKVYDELGGTETRMSSHLGLEALYQIATLPESERTKTHITATGEEKKPEDMTVRELREVKRQLKEAKQQRDTERRERERLESENESLSDRLEEIPEAVEPEVRVETRTEYVERIPEELRDRTFDTPSSRIGRR